MREVVKHARHPYSDGQTHQQANARAIHDGGEHITAHRPAVGLEAMLSAILAETVVIETIIPRRESVDLPAVALVILAAVAVFRLRLGVLKTLAVTVARGLLLRFAISL